MASVCHSACKMVLIYIYFIVVHTDSNERGMTYEHEAKNDQEHGKATIYKP